jgi:hypothetical protein
MPKRGNDPIPTALLISNNVSQLDPDLRISPSQVVVLTGLSSGQLKEFRRTRPPTPPLTLPRDKKGAKVWYRLGEVLEWRRARTPAATTRTKAPDTFHAFIARGAFEDTWPFARTTEGQPLDFFASLRMADRLDHGAKIVWLSLDEYLRETDAWVAAQRAGATARLLAKPDVLPIPNAAGKCPRCGKTATPRHICRL